MASIPNDLLRKLLIKHAGVPPKEAILVVNELDELRQFDTEAALLADLANVRVGSFAYAIDTGAVFLRGAAEFTLVVLDGAVFLGTEGSVLFAGVGGVISEDNTNFFWDDTLNRLQIVGQASVKGTGTDSEQYGFGAQATGNASTALGNAALASALNSLAVGDGAQATVDNAAALGQDATASGANGSTAVGKGSFATGSTSTALGNNSVAPAGGTVAAGQGARANNTNASALGQGAIADGSSSVAFGQLAGSGFESVSLGKSATGTGSRAVAIGKGATTGAFADAIAVGKDAAATANNDGQWGSSANPSDFNMYGDASIPGKDSVNGQVFGIRSVTALLSALTGASVSAASLIPAGSVVMGVTARVTTAITGATGFDFGDGVDVDRWGANIAIALDTTSDNSDWTDQALTNFAAANDVVLTALGGSFTAGAVRITVHYMSPTAPTS